jgi:hypothetical protein
MQQQITSTVEGNEEYLTDLTATRSTTTLAAI